MHSQHRIRTGWLGLVAQATLALAALVPLSSLAETETETEAPPVDQPRNTHVHRAGTLEGRVAILTRALDLDAPQQLELRKVLEDQRARVGKIWDRTSVPAALRVSETEALSDQIADRIRALLNEEQRKKYNPPKQRPPTEGSPKPDVSAWMNQTQGDGAAAATTGKQGTAAVVAAPRRP